VIAPFFVMAFDSVKAVHTLESCGIPRNQAEGMVAVMVEAARSEAATKGDVRDSESRMTSRLDALNSRITALDDKFAARMEGLSHRLIVQLGGMLLTALTMHFGAIWLVFNNIFVHR
jgi:hypothetical protein